MNAGFVEGAEAACREAGVDPGLVFYKKAYEANPSAFLRGMEPFVKRAAKYEDESLWDRIRPWLLGIGGLALAAGAGSMWGRYANARGYDEGPILGPFKALGRNIAGLPSPIEERDKIISSILEGADPAAVEGFRRAYRDTFQNANGADAAARRAVFANIDSLPNLRNP